MYAVHKRIIFLNKFAVIGDKFSDVDSWQVILACAFSNLKLVSELAFLLDDSG